ncbi:unnamed protein product [Sphagnum jensenii]|uniref:Uncharacterized protein n=1 Tax=Sphagnum jensenii TaxID=128206 RepID=A0ABP0VE34_9BRYO
MHLARLKRANSSMFTSAAPGGNETLSATACTYSCYLVALSRLICYTQSHFVDFKSAPRLSTQQLIEEFGGGDELGEGSTHYSEKSADIGRIDIRAIEQSLQDRIVDSGGINSSGHAAGHTAVAPINTGYLDVIVECGEEEINTLTDRSFEDKHLHDSEGSRNSLHLQPPLAEGEHTQPPTRATRSLSKGLISSSPLMSGYMTRESTLTHTPSPTDAASEWGAGRGSGAAFDFVLSPAGSGHNGFFVANTADGKSFNGDGASRDNGEASPRPPETATMSDSSHAVEAAHCAGGLNSTITTLATAVAPATVSLLTRQASVGPGGGALMAAKPRSRANTLARWRSDSTAQQVQDKEIEDSAKLALRVALEALNCLSRLDEPADDAVYRIIDLVVHMGDEGLQADNQMLSSVARAIAVSNGAVSIADAAVSRNGDIMDIAPGKLSVAPADVWVLQDWQWAQAARNTLYRRKRFASAEGSTTGGALGGGAARRPSVSSTSSRDASAFDTVVDWFMGSGTAGSKDSTKGGTIMRNGSFSLSAPKSSSFFRTKNLSPKNVPRQAGTLGSVSSDPLTPFPRILRKQSSSKSYRPIELPRLKWRWAPGERVHPKQVYSASRRLSRQMAVAEELLVGLFPGLHVNLEQPLGMACPGIAGQPCPLQRPLTLDEIYEGWEQGDANKYTTTCIACGRAFVPRFTVECRARNWVGSEGPRSPLWCELLSPWTLRKELFTVLFEEGVEHVTAQSFRHPSLSPQNAVLFWNILVAFRLHGLPYSFLLCGQSITSAFPVLAPAAPATSQAPGSSDEGAPASGSNSSTTVQMKTRRSTIKSPLTTGLDMDPSGALRPQSAVSSTA